MPPRNGVRAPAAQPGGTRRSARSPKPTERALQAKQARVGKAATGRRHNTRAAGRACASAGLTRAQGKRKLPPKAGGPCIACHTNETCQWRLGKASGQFLGKPICNRCWVADKRHGPEFDPEGHLTNKRGGATGRGRASGKQATGGTALAPESHMDENEAEGSEAAAGRQDSNAHQDYHGHYQEDGHEGTSAETLGLEEAEASSLAPKRGRKRSASDAGADDEAGANKRPAFNLHASAGEAAHAAAMLQQQQQQQAAHNAACHAAEMAANAEANTAAGTAGPAALGSSSPAALQEDTSLDEEEAAEALLGLTAQASGSPDISFEDTVMVQAEAEDDVTNLQ